MDIIEFLGWMAFFYIVWQLLKSWIFVQNLKQQIRGAIDEEIAAEHTKQQINIIQFEHVEQGSYKTVLVYEHETNRFLGQAETQAAAESMLQNRYPKKNFVIVNNKATVKGTINTVDTKPI